MRVNIWGKAGTSGIDNVLNGFIVIILKRDKNWRDNVINLIQVNIKEVKGRGKKVVNIFECILWIKSTIVVDKKKFRGGKCGILKTCVGFILGYSSCMTNLFSLSCF